MVARLHAEVLQWTFRPLEDAHASEKRDLSQRRSKIWAVPEPPRPCGCVDPSVPQCASQTYDDRDFVDRPVLVNTPSLARVGLNEPLLDMATAYHLPRYLHASGLLHEEACVYIEMMWQ
jgi:hypothetical protein